MSYEALTAHVAIVFMRYMMLAAQKRDNEDERTLGVLFYLAIDEMADLQEVKWLEFEKTLKF